MVVKIDSFPFFSPTTSLTLNITESMWKDLQAESSSTDLQPPKSEWMALAAHMYVPFAYIKGVGRVHNEYDGYEGHIINQVEIWT